MLQDYLIFNSDRHEYSIQYDPKKPIVIPSVTQLLQYGHIVDSTFIAPHYAIDGSEMHTMTELIDQCLYEDTLTDSRVHAALVGYELFLQDHDVLWEQTEQITFHEELFYAGTKDRLGIIDGKRMLVDLKSGHRYRWHVIQLAAYLMCEPDPVDVADLYLGTGDYTYYDKWTEDDIVESANLFRSIAKLWWYNHPRDHKNLMKIREEMK